MTKTPFLLAGALAASLLACEGPEPGSGGAGGGADLSVRVLALGGGSCAEPGTEAIDDITSVTINISGFDEELGDFTTLVEETRKLGGKGSLTITGVPEGVGHKLVLLGKGAEHDWYAAEPNLTVLRNESNQVDLLLARHGGFTCLDSLLPTSFANVVFPAAVELGDGSVFIAGGFTHVTASAGKTTLTGGSNAAFLFDPKTGEVVENLFMPAASGRGAHAMVYLPSPDGSDAGRVLILGGAAELTLDEGKSFPFLLEKEKGLRDYLLFDVSTRKFVLGAEEMRIKRAFPRAHRLNDGTVVITGGGEWPHEASQDYSEAEVFDPDAEDTEDPDTGVVRGAFLPTTGFEFNVRRAGHSLTFIKNSQDGLSQLLVWGGTFAEASGKDEIVAEVLKQSGQQKEGIDGSFGRVEVEGADLPYTFFHEMTALGGGRFLLTGGARATCTSATKFDTCSLEAPAPDEAWLVTYTDEGGNAKAAIEKVPGLGAGRVFHTAHLAGPSALAVVGGFADLSAVQVDKVMHFDVDAKTWTAAPETGSAFADRGGHAGITMSGSAILLLGGELQLDESVLDGKKKAFGELYVPSNVPLP